MIVIKFGGSVLTGPHSLPKIKHIISKELNKKIIVVVSAFENITDKLIECAYNANNPEYSTYIINFHKDILKGNNLPDNLLDSLFEEFTKAIESIKIYKEVTPKIVDHIMSFGERFSARILSAYLNANGYKTKPVEGHEIGIITDSNFSKATPLPSTYSAVAQFCANIDYIPIVTGFIAKNVEGNYTTLGRNGSDYTAAIISSACSAEMLKIYSNVDGILSGNPEFIENPQPIEELSLSEYQELQLWLTRIHPQMLCSVIEKNIPILILNANNENFPGTKISYKTSTSDPKVLIFRDDVFFILIEVPKEIIYVEVLKTITDYLITYNLKPLHLDIKNSQISLILTGSESVKEFINAISHFYTIYTYIDKVTVKIIGENINKDNALLVRILEIAKKFNFEVSFFSSTFASPSLTFMVQKKDNLHSFLNYLHSALILQAK
jgi:aspartate kinase